MLLGAQIAVRVDQAGLEASFPQRARAPMSAIEARDIVLSKPGHGRRQPTRGWRGEQQMHVVCHQHIGMQRDALLRKSHAEKPTITCEVLVIQERRRAIDAPMRDMHRYTR